MTLDAWLATREPAPPPALAARLRSLLGAHGRDDVETAAEAYLDAGEALLQALLRDGRTSRETALDLLAVDALVTYAFEAAASAPERLEERAQRAMARISALATAPEA